MLYNNKSLKHEKIINSTFQNWICGWFINNNNVKRRQRPSRSAEASVFPARSHRFLEVRAGQLAVLRVVVEHRAELQVRAGLHSLRGLELEDGLQAVHTQADFGRARGSEMFGETEQSQIPRVRSLRASRHLHHNNNNNTRARRISREFRGPTLNESWAESRERTISVLLLDLASFQTTLATFPSKST